MKPADSFAVEGSFPRQFNTTHWSVVLLAGRNESPQSAEALEKLCRLYWGPLYSFVRCKGHSAEDAQDLTQKFFARLLEKNDFLVVDPRKGKFRTFLLTALTHFLANERDYTNAAKRGGGQKLLSLDEDYVEHSYQIEPVSDLSPDKLYDLRWATTVLEEALNALKAEMVAADKTSQFEQLKPFLTEEPDAGAYARTGERLSLSRETVAVAVHRLRRRYHELVREQVAQTVTSPLELDEEMRHLFQALNR